MKKRGKVLRDAASGPGLLMLEGQQYHFSPEGVWKSDTLPKPGQVVDVELDAAGKVRSITVVPDSQLALEQADAARTRHPHASFLTKIGPPRLAAPVVLAGAWFFLTTVSVQVPFPGTMDFTLWQILGILHDGRLKEMLLDRHRNCLSRHSADPSRKTGRYDIPRRWSSRVPGCLFVFRAYVCPGTVRAPRPGHPGD